MSTENKREMQESSFDGFEELCHEDHEECQDAAIPGAEKDEEFLRIKQQLLDHLDSLLRGELSEEDVEETLDSTDDEELNEYFESYDTWNDLFYDAEGRKDRVMLTYDNVPFNMLGTFWSYQFWDKDLIIACVDFKKKYDEWPTAIVANEATYEQWEQAVRAQLDSSWSEDDEDDEYEELPDFNSDTRMNLENADVDRIWADFDTDIPLDEITPEGVPIEFGEDFATPFFRLALLLDDKFEEGVFRLMYGEGPDTDDGEEIPDENEKCA